MDKNKPEKAPSRTAWRSNLRVWIKKLKVKLKDFWTDNYDEIISGIIVFLLVAAGFGLGVFYGAKFYEDSQININCPASFWEEGQ
ncbi:MAG: hypothetical protein UX26_C0022G0013 [Parcubacteria group bacterium GW2011_GWC1_45_9]|nr:MAG: hypothetical protein UX26_C0022G0013 [Parcubacteria group bacterium GW2011_GWC1_45_9]HCI05632.1 hypothetical protein [Patescibacteria group bacterium]